MIVYSIITGDIVASGKIKPATRQKLLAAVNGLLKGLRRKWISGYETYRGDSLQCATILPETALRVALIIRSFLKAYSATGGRLTGQRKKRYAAKGYFATSFDIRLAAIRKPIASNWWI